MTDNSFNDKFSSYRKAILQPEFKETKLITQREGFLINKMSFFAGAIALVNLLQDGNQRIKLSDLQKRMDNALIDLKNFHDAINNENMTEIEKGFFDE